MVVVVVVVVVVVSSSHSSSSSSSSCSSSSSSGSSSSSSNNHNNSSSNDGISKNIRNVVYQWAHGSSRSSSSSSSRILNRIIQPTIESDEIILILGTLAHTSMPALQTMTDNMPRIIQNCKIHANINTYFSKEKSNNIEDWHIHQRLDWIQSIPTTSLIYNLYTRPIGLLKELEGGEYLEEVQNDSNRLLELFLKE